ncbi:MAG: hypothetical protein JXQ85_12725 [Cognatishimia sp.]|uniref:hypothetical protein n=1 Tax=Cognatishimia sp. TaxID=2211648 RepID=UPI003B8C9BFF
MQTEQANLWEDDKYVYFPEELFEYLPEDFRKVAETTKQRGMDVLRVVDKDLQGLIKLANAVPTTMNLSYAFNRLRTAEFDASMESIMEQEMLTSAFIVSYAKLFASGKGATGISKSRIPAHLQGVHEDIMQLRNKRYAHNDAHETMGSSVSVQFEDDSFHVGTHLNFGFHVGGRDEWEELVRFVNAHMHERLTKTLNKLKEKTGYEWSFPNGPAPDWVGNYD